MSEDINQNVNLEQVVVDEKKEIKELVVERIASSGKIIAERIIEHLAEEEISKRVQKVISAFTNLDNARKDLRKLKPDVISYNIDGLEVSKAWSKENLKNYNETSAKITKIQKAIDEALEKNNYSLLDSLGGGDKKKDE